MSRKSDVTTKHPARQNSRVQRERRSRQLNHDTYRNGPNQNSRFSPSKKSGISDGFVEPIHSPVPEEKYAAWTQIKQFDHLRSERRALTRYRGMTTPDSNLVTRTFNSICNHAIDGVGPLSSAAEMTRQYVADASYKNRDARADAMIRWETAKAGSTGFVTGLGGLIVLPITIPAGMATNWILQARLAAGIAGIYGYNPTDERVKTLAMLAVLGDAGREVIKTAGVEIGKRVGIQLIQKVPGRVLIEINKQVGFRLLTKAGEKGVINLTKMVPFLGAGVGATVDSFACYTTGKVAKEFFACLALHSDSPSLTYFFATSLSSLIAPGLTAR